jgi:hypothetical protein
MTRARETNARGAASAKRFHQQVGDAEIRGPLPQVCGIETAGLNLDHAEDIVPLTIGYLAVLAEPD